MTACELTHGSVCTWRHRQDARHHPCQPPPGTCWPPSPRHPLAKPDKQYNTEGAHSSLVQHFPMAKSLHWRRSQKKNILSSKHQRKLHTTATAHLTTHRCYIHLTTHRHGHKQTHAHNHIDTSISVSDTYQTSMELIPDQHGILWPCLTNNTAQRVLTLRWYNTHIMAKSFHWSRSQKKNILSSKHQRKLQTGTIVHRYYTSDNTQVLYIWQYTGTDTNTHNHNHINTSISVSETYTHH